MAATVVVSITVDGGFPHETEAVVRMRVNQALQDADDERMHWNYKRVDFDEAHVAIVDRRTVTS